MLEENAMQLDVACFFFIIKIVRDKHSMKLAAPAWCETSSRCSESTVHDVLTLNRRVEWSEIGTEVANETTSRFGESLPICLATKIAQWQVRTLHVQVLITAVFFVEILGAFGKKYWSWKLTNLLLKDIEASTGQHIFRKLHYPESHLLEILYLS